MSRHEVKLIHPDGREEIVLRTDSKDEAEGYIKASKELRPGVRHQLGTVAGRDFGFVCYRQNVRGS